MKSFFLFLFSLLFIIVSVTVPTTAFADDCAQITEKPTLYQVTQSGSNAALYFTPVNSQTTGYTINYGLSQGDDRYNVDFLYGNSSGAITYTVGGLDTSLHYFFRVRAKNACSTGPYSDWLAANVIGGLNTIQGGATDSASTTGSGAITAPTATPTRTAVPVTGVSSILLMSLAALGLCVVGGGLFFKGKKGFSL